MHKMKSSRSAAKRFRKTGTGKISRNKAYARHILTSKSPKRKRHLRSDSLVSPSDMTRIKRQLPYL